MSTQTLKSLNDLRWTYRVLLVQTTAPESFLKQCQEQAPALADRKLLVVVFKKEASPLPGYQLNQDLELTPGLAQTLHQNLDDHHAILIGLDGGIKAHFTPQSFRFESVFAKIDAMPMRQQELRKRQPE